VLAAIGLYGVLSYGIARRRGELAIRIALGAEPGRVITMVLHETALLILGGLVVGGALTYGASRVIKSQLFGVTPQDPLTLAMAVGLLLLVALSAVYLPARRASKIDPMSALRGE
jgi:putative ABC transport system permease protein